MSDSEDPIDNIDDGGDDLFGDDDGDQPLSEVEDAPSDRDLASDRDEDEPREHQYGGDGEPVEFTNKTTQEVPMYRHRIPRSKDDGLISFRVPEFIKFNPLEYKPDTWEPTKWDVQNAMSDTPVPSVLFRRDPKTGQMRSNANVYKWSDGSVTVAVGDEHFEIQTKPLAPPPDKPYKEVSDTHYYAAAAHLTTNSLLVIGHFTEQYTVRPNAEVQDHALELLKARMIAEDKKRSERDNMIVPVTEDPELKRKQAEQAEKEAMRAQRRRENAAARAEGTSSRFKGGSLSVGDLEGRRGAGGRKRGAPGGSKKKHRKPEYDSDDDLPGGVRQNDNYDMDDGFLVDSDDDDSEQVDDDEEEEDILDDEDEAEAPRKRQKTKTTAVSAPRPVVDEDADGEVDDEDEPAQEATSSRRRRQHIIDDDDEE